MPRTGVGQARPQVFWHERTRSHRVVADSPGIRISGRKSREHQVVKAQLNRDEVAWAAGLFVGEGSVGITYWRPKRDSSVHAYPSFDLKMLDGRSVEAFCDAFGLNFLVGPYKQERSIYRVTGAGTAAAEVLRAMYPCITDTRKGEQVRNVFEAVGRPLAAAQDTSVVGSSSSRIEQVRTQGRRPRSWLLDVSKFNPLEVIWASGLFAGEGYAGIEIRKKGSATYRYPVASVTMLDENAVSRFASAFFASAFALRRSNYSSTAYRVHLRGSGAEACIRAMYPHLFFTDKGDQIVRQFETLGLELNPDGTGRTWTRTNGLRGRSLTLAHRAAISAGQARRWERWRSAL
jgi:hypothetical protein